jgi:hypothetical protein
MLLVERLVMNTVEETGADQNSPFANWFLLVSLAVGSVAVRCLTG